MKTEATRPYRQQARARGATENTQRIVAAARELFGRRLYDQVSMADVAERAEVSLQTLIRRFPTKEALVAGVGEHVRAEVVAQRGEAPSGDVPTAVANLVGHYEREGDTILLLLAQEERVEPFREIVARGRELHRNWTARVFGDRLEPLSHGERRVRLAQYVAMCDVYTWKVLRRDQGLGRATVERALVQMIEGVSR